MEDTEVQPFEKATGFSVSSVSTVVERAIVQMLWFAQR
jgi:hypothetical protein